MTNVIDFDAFRAEQKAEPVRLIIGGETYALPSSLPAALALDVIRMQANGKAEGDEVDEQYLETIGKALFGGDLFLEVIQKHNITLSELPDLIRLVFAAYQSPAPNREGRRARPKKSTQPISSATGD